MYENVVLYENELQKTIKKSYLCLEEEIYYHKSYFIPINSVAYTELFKQGKKISVVLILHCTCIHSHCKSQIAREEKEIILKRVKLFQLCILNFWEKNCFGNFDIQYQILSNDDFQA